MVYSGWQDADIQNREAEPAWQGKLGAGRGRELEEGMDRNRERMTTASGDGSAEGAWILSYKLNYVYLFRAC